MPNQRLWDHIDVALPDLPYQHCRISSQGKGSTTWACHSHTPCSVSKWVDFDSLIQAEALKDENSVVLNANVEEEVAHVERNLQKVKEEQDVTDNTNALLLVLSRLSTFEFSKNTSLTLSNPDLLAQRKVDEGIIGGYDLYESPANRATVRRVQVQEMSEALLFPFETKPAWKFHFLMAENSTEQLIDLWEIPAGYTPDDLLNQRALPEGWSREKKKVFHLIRQVYGQMASCKRKYGVAHIYERWWFCRRNAAGELEISRPFKKEAKSPSVWQAIKTLAGLDDLVLEEVGHHPAFAIKGRDAKPKTRQTYNRLPQEGMGTVEKKSPPTRMSHGDNSKRSTTCAAGLAELASSIYMWECRLVDFTNNVKLLSFDKDPSVLVKAQRDPRVKHVAQEMEHEAEIYRKLSQKTDLKAAIPTFRGFSTHLGVPLLCLGKEGPDFEDIGLENLSHELKVSAVDCMRLLSKAGVLHRDVSLRNIVQSKENPKKAKIIDFGRAEFSDNLQLLEEQVETIKYILELQ